MSDDSLDLLMGLDEWTVELEAGGTIRVRALAFSKEGGYFVFSGLERGVPNRNVDLFWIPVEIVKKHFGSGPF